METLGRLGWRTSLYNASLAQGVPSLWRFRARGASFGGGGMGGGQFRGFAEGLYAHDHLLAAQEGVANELARAQSHLRVRHDDGWLSWIEVVVGVFCVGERSPAASNVVGGSAVLVRISFLAAKWLRNYFRALAHAGKRDACNYSLDRLA